MITQRKKGFIVKDIWIEINTGQACKLIKSMHGILVSPARNEKIQKEYVSVNTTCKYHACNCHFLLIAIKESSPQMLCLEKTWREPVK
jgi:hypothetical protein